MNRLILTLLALLTGLAAQVSPAQAAVAGVSEAEVGSVQAPGTLARIARVVEVRIAAASRLSATGVVHPAAVLTNAPGVMGVLIGIDRARE